MKGTVAVLAAVIAVVALLFIATEQTPSPGMTAADIAGIEAEVTDFAQRWMEVWSQNDCEAGAAFLKPEGLAFLWNGRVLDRETWVEECTPLVELRESFAGAWKDITVQVLTPNSALFVGTYTDTIRYTDGVHRTWADNSQMGLVERTAEGWVFATLASTSGAYEDVVEEG